MSFGSSIAQPSAIAFPDLVFSLSGDLVEEGLGFSDLPLHA